MAPDEGSQPARETSLKMIRQVYGRTSNLETQRRAGYGFGEAMHEYSPLPEATDQPQSIEVVAQFASWSAPPSLRSSSYSQQDIQESVKLTTMPAKRWEIRYLLLPLLSPLTAAPSSYPKRCLWTGCQKWQSDTLILLHPAAHLEIYMAIKFQASRFSRCVSDPLRGVCLCVCVCERTTALAFSK